MSKYNKKSDGMPIYAGGKFTGRLAGNVFYVERRNSGFLTTPPAIAFNDEAIAQLPAGTVIQVTNTDTGRVYSTDLTFFQVKSFEVNRIREPQHAMTIKMWNVTGAYNYPHHTMTEVGKYASNTTEAPKPETVQMSLFAGM